MGKMMQWEEGIVWHIIMFIIFSKGVNHPSPWSKLIYQAISPQKWDLVNTVLFVTYFNFEPNIISRIKDISQSKDIFLIFEHIHEFVSLFFS